MNIQSEQIRRTAGAWRADILKLPLNRPVPARAVLAAADAATGYRRILLPANDPLLAGAQAVLDREAGTIWQSETQPRYSLHFDGAHEYAHHALHSLSCRCASGQDLAENGLGADPALERVEGYSPRQLREREANVFAGELLLPTPLIRRLFLERGFRAATIARHLGLSVALVRARLAESVLTPIGLFASAASLQEEQTPALSGSIDLTGLDPSQRKAAEIPCGPFLLGAGPGTGKTRTLVARCVHLTRDRGVAPTSILALTFSNKAAEEMRERLIAAGVGTRESGPWIGTFHAFGLEILRRYADRADLPAEWKLIDSLDAFMLLESSLDELNLDELGNVNQPALHLKDILRAISRAKDELRTPAKYAELAHLMRQDALESEDPKEMQKAARAWETARVYAFYEEVMRRHGFVDFGDLIFRAVTLLETSALVCEGLRREYPHVLADEYQDVNRGCARLVRLLAGDAEGLWAVGDHRQSIYRFRGASPANIAAFEKDYPGGTRAELGVNYRSRPPIVRLFTEAARTLGTFIDPDAVSRTWDCARDHSDAEPPAVIFAVADDEEAQADGVADAIRRFQSECGHAYQDQAILCRTHSQAQGLAERLIARGVPICYLGDLLERPEIKDLLSILSLCATDSSHAASLMRVASFPEYELPAEVAALAARRIESSGLGTRAALSDPTVLSEVTDASCRASLARLAKCLAHCAQETDPAALLERFLFQESTYLTALRANELDDPLGTAMRLLAIRQLLALARATKDRLGVLFSSGSDPGAPVKSPRNAIRQFLSHVRRLVMSGENPVIGLPADLDGIDAVRIITAHAAKGLEFPVVFVPNLSERKFPTRGRPAFIPEPPGLIEGTSDWANADDREEAYLFFVALSRAREHLVLSRARFYHRAMKETPASSLLELIQGAFGETGITETVWTASDAPDPDFSEDFDEGVTIDVKPIHSASELEQYRRCPRQYYYERVLNLQGADDVAANRRYHQCARRMLAWLQDEGRAGNALERETALAALDRFWQEAALDEHPYKEMYRRRMEDMIERACLGNGFGSMRLLAPVDGVLTAELSNCRVRVSPDVVGLTEDGALVLARQQVRKAKDDDHTDIRLALYRRAASDTHPDKTSRIELRYVLDGEERVIPPSTRWEPGRLKKYEEAAAKIALKQFPAMPEDGMCASCPFYFVCPA